MRPNVSDVSALQTSQHFKHLSTSNVSALQTSEHFASNVSAIQTTQRFKLLAFSASQLLEFLRTSSRSVTTRLNRTEICWAGRADYRQQGLARVILCSADLVG